MKILHVIPSLRKGGAERIALDICAELISKGHKVKIVTLYSENQYRFISDKFNYECIKTYLNLSLLRKNQVDVSALQKIIDNFQPDIIHSHLFESEIHLAFCRFPKGIKRVIHFHDNMIQMKSLSWRTFFNKTLFTNFYERFLILRNLPKQSAAIGISKNSTEYINKMLPSRINKILLPNAIDLNRFQKSKQTKNGVKIIMIGSLNELKGQELAIRTISELKKRNISISLSLVGDGPSKQKLEQLAVTLDVVSVIDFIGSIDYPERELQNAHVYLHTSNSEAFGLVLIEAMACGLPVVCTDGKGNRDLIVEGENGFMVWERDPKLLADKIEILFKNEDLRMEMGEKARIYAQEFGMEKYVTELLAIYKS